MWYNFFDHVFFSSKRRACQTRKHSSLCNMASNAGRDGDESVRTDSKAEGIRQTDVNETERRPKGPSRDWHIRRICVGTPLRSYIWRRTSDMGVCSRGTNTSWADRMLNPPLTEINEECFLANSAVAGRYWQVEMGVTSISQAWLTGAHSSAGFLVCPQHCTSASANQRIHNYLVNPVRLA